VYSYNNGAGFAVLYLVIIAGLAFIPAYIAAKKGRNFGLWYIYGFFLWLIALIHSLCIRNEHDYEVPSYFYEPAEHEDSVQQAPPVTAPPALENNLNKAVFPSRTVEQIECPNCQKTQMSNRNSCYSCGCEFQFEDEKDTATL
jgi:uncharacterized protein (DUF983 family)